MFQQNGLSTILYPPTKRRVREQPLQIVRPKQKEGGSERRRGWDRQRGGPHVGQAQITSKFKRQ